MSLPAQYQRYLRLLEIDGLPAGLEGLRRIVYQHLLRVPFENVSKLLLLNAEGAGRITALPEFLDGIEYQDLGGACYTNNPFAITRTSRCRLRRTPAAAAAARPAPPPNHPRRHA
jgi:arylamine N-acetyltransferase